ncbi:MAG: Non-canonical purine NTP pyrophosphatase [Parcubacteria group bacterium GW2011_GWC2_38_7]|nr:MAG: Non-canonical purine NTP pyrophosphatase [Parcubacteria group bacterium GW2011_GWC2_38_7]
MKLVIATHNQGKAQEIKKFLALWDVEALSLDDLNITDDVEETGTTFQENALIKAKFFCKLTKLPTLADDAGLEIDALNGEPGVKSRRWNGTRMTDQELIDYTFEKLKNVPVEKRSCRLVSVIALCVPGQEPKFGRGTIEGSITVKQELPIQEGYPFRSIFYVPKYKKMLGALSPAEHAESNHRLDALKQLKPWIIEQGSYGQ